MTFKFYDEKTIILNYFNLPQFILLYLSFYQFFLINFLNYVDLFSNLLLNPIQYSL